MNILKFKDVIPPDLYKKYFGVKENVKLFHGKGCSFCSNTGFSGRLGIFEVLEVTDARSLIMQRSNADIITQKALQEGMTTMFEDGIKKVQKGVTTIEEVLRNAISK